MSLCCFQHLGGQFGRGQGIELFVLSINQMGQQEQVGTNGIAVSQLTQTCCSVSKDAGSHRQAQSGDGGVVQTFDFAARKDALQDRLLKTRLPCPKWCMAAGLLMYQSPAYSAGRLGPFSISSRNQARWCFQAQARVTVPRVMALTEPFTQIPA